MTLPAKIEKHLDSMRLVEAISRSLDTVSWIFGGFVTDIYVGRVLREHEDLDYLTLNLHALKSKFAEAFLRDGWLAKNLVNGDLKLKKDDVKIHVGNVELGETAKWTHNGQKGSLHFPVSWLSFDPVEFAGMKLHVVAPELQYVLKEHSELMNPDWVLREKDLLEKKYLREFLIKKGIKICSLHKLVNSN